MTTARLIRLDIGISLTEVLADDEADVVPVVLGHGGAWSGVEGVEEFCF